MSNFKQSNSPTVLADKFWCTGLSVSDFEQCINMLMGSVYIIELTGSNVDNTIQFDAVSIPDKLMDIEPEELQLMVETTDKKRGSGLIVRTGNSKNRKNTTFLGRKAFNALLKDMKCDCELFRESRVEDVQALLCNVLKGSSGFLFCRRSDNGYGKAFSFTKQLPTRAVNPINLIKKINSSITGTRLKFASFFINNNLILSTYRIMRDEEENASIHPGLLILDSETTDTTFTVYPIVFFNDNPNEYIIAGTGFSVSNAARRKTTAEQHEILAIRNAFDYALEHCKKLSGLSQNPVPLGKDLIKTHFAGKYKCWSAHGYARWVAKIKSKTVPSTNVTEMPLLDAMSLLAKVKAKDLSSTADIQILLRFKRAVGELMLL